MYSKIKIEIEEEGKYGYINFHIDGYKLRWYWEFGSGNIVAIIRIPDPKEWREIFSNSKYKRNVLLPKVAEEICRQKCEKCRYEITDNTINIIEE